MIAAKFLLTATSKNFILYTAEVNNRFQAFQDLEEDRRLNQSTTISAHDKAAKKHIPVKNKVKQNVPQVSNDTAEKRRAVFEALDYSNLVKTRYSAKKFNDARIKPEEAYVKEQERYAQGKVDEIRTAAEHQKSKLAWKTVNEFTGGRGTNKGKTKTKNPEDCIKKWKDHFQDCQNRMLRTVVGFTMRNKQ